MPAASRRLPPDGICAAGNKDERGFQGRSTGAIAAAWRHAGRRGSSAESAANDDHHSHAPGRDRAPVPPARRPARDRSGCRAVGEARQAPRSPAPRPATTPASRPATRYRAGGSHRASHQTRARGSPRGWPHELSQPPAAPSPDHAPPTMPGAACCTLLQRHSRNAVSTEKEFWQCPSMYWKEQGRRAWSSQSLMAG